MSGLRLKALLGLLLLAAAFGATSCASTQSDDNASARPWNAPQGWEYGLPGGMMDRQGR